MLFKNLFSAALLATSAIAAPRPSLKTRDLATLTSVLNDVSGSLLNVQAAIDTFSGTQEEGEAVQAASDQLIADIQAGIVTIGPTSGINLLEALQIMPAATAVISEAEATVQALIAKKDLFANLGQVGAVRKGLEDLKAEGSAMLAIVTTKLPELVRGIAAEQGAVLVALCDEGIAAFSDPARFRARL